MHGRGLRAVVCKLSRRLAMTESPSRHFVLLFIKRKGAGRMPFRSQRMVWTAKQKRSTHAEKLLREADRGSQSRIEIGCQAFLVHQFVERGRPSLPLPLGHLTRPQPARKMTHSHSDDEEHCEHHQVFDIDDMK